MLPIARLSDSCSRPRMAARRRRAGRRMVSSGMPAVTRHDQVLYETPLVKIGAFRCGRNHPAFENSGPIENYCFVFPRTAVVIEHDHDWPFVANPNVVNFYNVRDEYRRRPIADEGDRSDWFGLRHDVVVEVVRSIAPSVDDRPEEPFAFTHALSTARAYAFQRQLFTRISSPVAPEPIEIEESVVWLLRSLLRSAYRCAARSTPSGDTRQRSNLVRDAQALLSREFARDVTLTEVADALDVSVFHLCHVFRRLTGCSLHQYRHQLRLRWSLEQLCTSARPSLVQCALDAGFSSHSHYGTAFKRAFGQTPSDFRTTAESCARSGATASAARAGGLDAISASRALDPAAAR
jgi:AraC family transcriptional regulator